MWFLLGECGIPVGSSWDEKEAHSISHTVARHQAQNQPQRNGKKKTFDLIVFSKCFVSCFGFFMSRCSKFLTKKAALNCIEHKISTENVSLTLTNHYFCNTSSLLKMPNESTSKMATKRNGPVVVIPVGHLVLTHWKTELRVEQTFIFI